MTQTPIDRIEAFCRDKGIGSLSELGRLIGASTGTFSIIKKRGRPPGTQVMQMLSDKYPDLNSNWVLYGRGSMYVDDKRLAPAPFAQPAPAATPAPFAVAEPTPAYGCIAPDQVAALTLEVNELRAENKLLREEVRQIRKEAREDALTQGRNFAAVREDDNILITRLYAKVDEYELRLGYRQPTPEEAARHKQSEEERKTISGFMGQRYSQVLEEIEASRGKGKHFYLKTA